MNKENFLNYNTGEVGYDSREEKLEGKREVNRTD
jgi:hypothetical protein